MREDFTDDYYRQNFNLLAMITFYNEVRISIAEGLKAVMNSPFSSLETNVTQAEELVRQRDSILLKADISLPGQKKECAARIRNLSSGGMMVEAPVQVKNGEIVEVNLRNIGWVSGFVAWASGTRFGVAFDRPINPKMARKPVGDNNAAIPDARNRIADRGMQDKSKLRPI